MIKTVPEMMLHCLDAMGNLNGTDTTVLERQRARMMPQEQQLHRHLHHQQQQEQSYFSGNEFNAFPLQAQAQPVEGLMNTGSVFGELVTRVVKVDPACLEDDWANNLGRIGAESALGNWFGFELNNAVSRTANCSTVAANAAMEEAAMSDVTRRESILQEKQSSVTAKEISKKRKAEKSYHVKGVPEDDNNSRDKRIKGVAEDGESKITVQNSNLDHKTKSNNKETSTDTSKVSEVQKPDYIHVRARRGQATDSHSLAERLRREKISERMKYLQDLVPGCNKITGKAGMLDEIINYVQSLQRQVEFLSMKLAAVNPTLDFNIDNFFAEQVLPACSSTFATMIGATSEITNPPYLEFNSPLQQVVSCRELELGINTPDTVLQNCTTAPIAIPETFLNSPYLNHVLPYSTGDANLQNFYSSELFQGRSTLFQSQ